MARYRYAVVLPALSAVITSGLWLQARADYLVFVCPPVGVCNGEPGWTDYTPLSLQVAGMLSIPVAVFAHPLWQWPHDPVSTSKLLVLLVGVVMLWSYIGWKLDSVHPGPHRRTALRIVAAILGYAFSILILIETLTMFHVMFFYKMIGAFWSLLMLRHFTLLLRTSAPGQ